MCQRSGFYSDALTIINLIVLAPPYYNHSLEGKSQIMDNMVCTTTGASESGEEHHVRAGDNQGGVRALRARHYEHCGGEPRETEHAQ